MRVKAAIGATILGLLAGGCNDHPVSFVGSTAIVEYQQETSVDPSENLDLLWVIDNSGSMCQEQKSLRDNFDRFIEQLDETNLNLHIGVTTTHMEDDPRLFEPIARPGHLQSTPQPLPGYDRSCWTAVDENSENIAGDYTPIRDLITAAVACMREPDSSLLEFTDEEIACALEERDDCSIPGRCEAGACTSAALLPSPDSFRELPKVLRSEDYRTDGKLDIERLKQDFGCMALVGMRGYGFEKGLGAAVEAVSPDLTGGVEGGDGADASAPNHGFIRDDARFGLVFVTDENDCTHDGSLSEKADRCGDDLCDFWNHPDAQDSPLVEPATLKQQLMANLRATKGDEAFDDSEVLVASIHGNSKRYRGDIIPGEECRVDDASASIPSACGAFSTCSDRSYEDVPPTCATRLGEAYSGDRYERFIREFDNFFPEPNETAPEAPLTGWMCTGDFRPALEAIGEFLNTVPAGCITRPIRECAGPDDTCPAYAYGGGQGACRPVPNSDGEYFCDSYVQVRARASDAATLERLRESGYCYPESADGGTVGCVVDREHYELTACSGSVAGVRVRWVDEEAARSALAGTDLILRFASLAEK
jgi:hypothetical protein